MLHATEGTEGREAQGDSIMKHKILMHFVVETRDDRDAAEIARKLDKLLKTPLVRMAIEGEGIRLAHGDGKPVVYAPTRETT